jgi:hypothetical protein
MLTLRSDQLLARVDPAHGGEILDLIDLRTGRQLLGRPPFGSELPQGGDLDDATWTSSYRGGWQTVLPNAGNACAVGDAQHGFHGRASVDPWQVSSTSDASAELRWRGHGLLVEKTVRVADALRVDYRIEAERDGVPLVALEHLAAGLELLEPRVELDLPPTECYELDEVEGPTGPPEGCARWPLVSLRGGEVEHGGSWDASTPRSRLFVLHGLPAGWCAVRNPGRGQGLAVAWDVDWFRHCWIWHESRLSDGPWRSLTEMIAIEPATVPHSLGLARALEDGAARVLAAGETVTPWIVAAPFVANERPVTAVGPDGEPQFG